MVIIIKKSNLNFYFYFNFRIKHDATLNKKALQPALLQPTQPALPTQPARLKECRMPYEAAKEQNEKISVELNALRIKYQSAMQKLKRRIPKTSAKTHPKKHFSATRLGATHKPTT